MIEASYRERVGEAVDLIAATWGPMGDPEVATAMAAYMKTDMPFYGLKKPERTPLHRQLKRDLTPSSDDEYEHVVRTLWSLPRREEKYLAMTLAWEYRRFNAYRHMDLYRDLIVEGAWWDFVDHVSGKCVGHVLLKERTLTKPLMEEWVESSDMWLRRSALLAHLGHKTDTDEATLFDHCLRLAHEREFFIRKAIGWVLRQYARTAPDSVREFVLDHRDEWSGLTFREATKHLDMC